MRITQHILPGLLSPAPVAGVRLKSGAFWDEAAGGIFGGLGGAIGGIAGVFAAQQNAEGALDVAEQQTQQAFLSAEAQKAKTAATLKIVGTITGAALIALTLYLLFK